MNREQTLSQLQLPTELIDLIASYDSYELFDYYGMKKTCPIIQQIIQFKKNVHLLLSEKAERCIYDTGGSNSWCTYNLDNQSKKINFDYTMCGHCGKYYNSSSINLSEFYERDFFQDPRMCQCCICYEFLEDLTLDSGRNYML
jgi:hypothetical protein